ncbi:MAG: glycosyltransferase family 4 protein [Streptococcaceae bacterium]|jgi:1,2-diacylglycerol-3-alpha-glucose alpha-1,2-glucosyltransferase|nr:glycosyltransferase family 4 protein [Streptococcaceae bacterium]
MKILLYLEAEEFLAHSGIGRAMKHQQQALDLMGIEWTTDPSDDYDILHANTYGVKTMRVIKEAKKAGKKVIFHGHSTRADFRNSFIGSNFSSGFFCWWIMRYYKKADLMLTPTDYSAELIKSYGITAPIIPISNGINLAKYAKNEAKEAAFRDYFHIKSGEKVVVNAALYFKRKGIDDFIEVAKALPDVRFIWFGFQALWTIPAKIRRLVENPPKNVLFPGYIKGDVFEGALTAADAFFFPSREETEGIVVLEALASHQKVLVRDIPVYNGWLDANSVSFGSDVASFLSALTDILDAKVDKTAAGYAVAESRAIDVIAGQLAQAYEKVLTA